MAMKKETGLLNADINCGPANIIIRNETRLRTNTSTSNHIHQTFHKDYLAR